MNKMLNKNNKDLISVKYIIDENKDENFFVANIDLENISAVLLRLKKKYYFYHCLALKFIVLRKKKIIP